MTNSTNLIEDSLTLQFKQLNTNPSNISGGNSNSSSSSNSSIDEILLANGIKSSTSQNITESVPVPSSEHVAEIVGRQGSKIKALRTKTNTYIKTPIRGEAPMFTITGRREDVLIAKREIQLAADHFSQIRARRGSNSSSGGNSLVNGDTGCLTLSPDTLNAISTTSPKLIMSQRKFSNIYEENQDKLLKCVSKFFFEFV